MKDHFLAWVHRNPPANGPKPDTRVRVYENGKGELYVYVNESQEEQLRELMGKNRFGLAEYGDFCGHVAFIVSHDPKDTQRIQEILDGVE